jgi:hypothetical protein
MQWKKLVMLQSLAMLAFGAQSAQASGVNLNINLGEPRVVVPAPVYVAPPARVYVAPPAPVYVEEEDAQFIYPEQLGFYVAVGVPYDLFFFNNSYFVIRDGRWFRAQSSHGPWVAQRYRDLPPVLRRHRLERIREFRNREYVVYTRDREHYRGRELRSERGNWQEHKREMKAERREEKELRKEEKHFEKEQRKEDRRQEREERRER